MIAAAIVLGGCVSIQSYPESWEASSAARADHCPDLNGTYSNIGQSPSGVSGASLSGWLMREEGRGSLRPDRVGLELSEDSLTVRAVNREKSQFRVLSRRRGEFRCSNGVLEIPFTESCCYDMMSAVGSGTLRVTRTPGFVVLNIADIGAAIIVIVPLVYARQVYVRFPVVE